MIANNHGLALDRDPAEIMRENNKGIHEAAKTLSAKKGMVKQSVPGKKKQPVAQPEVAAYVPQRPVFVQPQNGLGMPTDAEMQKVGYDKFMQSMMDAPVVNESDMSELSDMVDESDKPELMPEEVTQPIVQPVNVPTQPEPKKQHEILRQTNAEPPKKSRVFSRQEVTNFTDVRGLPSECRLYDSPIFGQSLTLMDILMLNNMDSNNITTNVNTLFERRLTGGWDDGMNAENILQCDEAYLMHWLRASTIDDPLPYVPPKADRWEPFKCPLCGKTATSPQHYHDMPITFNQLDFKLTNDLSTVIKKHATGCYTFQLDDQRQCDVYLRRRYHERIINETEELYRNDRKKDMPLEMQILLHSAVIVEIEGLNNIVEKIDYLGNLGYKAARHFFDEVEAASLTTDITAKVICPFCKKEVVIPYPFRLDYYISSL